jgi:copper chaperone NosL
MTVVDKQHGAELVTTKGRVYVFDAIECLINYEEMEPLNQAEYLLVNDYQKPGVLMDAKNSFFLISEAIPSPMGAYLSAFSTRQEASNMASAKGGEVYNWTEIQRIINDVTYGIK